ncbi:MAG: hypothetical protein BWY99_02310 [Synergistetes bacterium ADurb.BinA166]|nr:MAG: hypothetical protein BWY99_02310 [Synergistetes bacterium ADurb.BinA166]
MTTHPSAATPFTSSSSPSDPLSMQKADRNSVIDMNPSIRSDLNLA